MNYVPAFLLFALGAVLLLGMAYLPSGVGSYLNTYLNKTAYCIGYTVSIPFLGSHCVGYGVTVGLIAGLGSILFGFIFLMLASWSEWIVYVR